MAGIKSNLQRLTNEIVSDKAERRKARAEREKQLARDRQERKARQELQQEKENLTKMLLPSALEMEFFKLENIKEAYTTDTRQQIMNKIGRDYGELAFELLFIENYKLYYKILKDCEKIQKQAEDNTPPTAEGVEELKKQIKILKFKNVICFLYELFKKILILPLILLYILWKIIGSGRKLYK